MVESESIHEGVKYACNHWDHQGSKEHLRCHLKIRHSMTQLLTCSQTTDKHIELLYSVTTYQGSKEGLRSRPDRGNLIFPHVFLKNVPGLQVNL